VLGVMVSALFSTSLNQELIMPLALNDWVATFSIMVFAAILSLCSTSDAFIAATLISSQRSRSSPFSSSAPCLI
jgi:uncharacterized membrane protein YraQ (UPF0718 family)